MSGLKFGSLTGGAEMVEIVNVQGSDNEFVFD